MFVSVVMPSYNQARYLPLAIESVLNQSWQKLELIVMDGGSTDGSKGILNKYQKKDARLRWWSEPDSGPANAINKALTKCRGTLVGWLNSDDLYTPKAIERAVKAMQAHSEWMLCYGWGEHIDDQGRYLQAYPTLPSKEAKPWQVPDKNAFQYGCFICQPSVFFKAVMPVLIGKLDENLKAAFDYDYWLRAFNAFPGRIGFIASVQAQSRLHEDCITQKQRRHVALEGMQVLAKNQGYALGHWVLTYQDEQIAKGLTHEQIKPDLAKLMNQIKPYMENNRWQTLLKSLNLPEVVLQRNQQLQSIAKKT